MATPILVTGGTGTLGRLVVQLLRDAGHDVRVLSRRDHEDGDGIEFVTGDLATGDGIDSATEGTEVIVHCAGTQKGDEDKARHLVRAASRAGTRHLVYISVVGADRVPVESSIDRAMFGYFASKFGAEEVVAASGLPWTTLRATQFHDLVLLVARSMAKLPLIPVPAGFRFQPIDTGEVANRLVELALGPPAALVPDVAGPRVYEMADLIRSYMRAEGKRRPIVPIPLPGKAARAIRAGAILAPDRAVGRRTWEDFLAAQSR
ncbi:MAG TPA: NAD(P)H-binding protein [Nitriliruptorales bacterium]|nr:NAD(P)H-binding protein [Nitriliruptorales bacterium]